MGSFSTFLAPLDTVDKLQIRSNEKEKTKGKEKGTSKVRTSF